MTFRTRFAPSPTGPLHLGHAYSALTAYDMASAAGGSFLLRIEDIDGERSKPKWEAQIFDDLDWLGVRWKTPLLRQSDNLHTYRSALQTLWQRGLLYPCFCNRRDIREAATAPQEGSPSTGPDGLIYPGTCKRLPRNPKTAIPENTVLRLDLEVAARILPDQLSFDEYGGDRAVRKPWQVHDLKKSVGDIVIARKDLGTSYHLSVVVDDAEQQITDVVRGHDLFEATIIHVILQKLLDLPTPRYYHHDLIRDEAGRRLAKRDDARAISKYRTDGATPDDIRRMVGLNR